MIRHGKGLTTAAAAIVALGMLGACAPRVQNLGNAPTQRALDEVKAGKSEADVMAALGSPSATGTFDPRIWYYISKRTETLAFFTPKVTDQNVLEIRFDNNGQVEDVKQYSLAESKDVVIAAGETPTIGREPGIIKSIYNTLLNPGGIFGGPSTNPEARGY